jgi:hypothetical protein
MQQEYAVKEEAIEHKIFHSPVPCLGMSIADLSFGILNRFCRFTTDRYEDQ